MSGYSRKIKNALEVFKDPAQVRKIFGYDLDEVWNVIREELQMRDEKMQSMIKSLKELVSVFSKSGEDNMTFMYYKESPEKMMARSEENTITDNCYQEIVKSINYMDKGTITILRDGCIQEVFELKIRNSFDDEGTTYVTIKKEKNVIMM